MAKFFPIQQGVACQLKWTWNTLRLREGTTHSCHRVRGQEIDLLNFDDFHNHPMWLQHRKMMLGGRFPQQGCEYCENIEKAGGTSDRMLHLKIPDLSPPELDSDAEAVRVTPRILEVFLDNTCNMACIYCDESNSSKIEQENRKFGRIDVEIIPRLTRERPKHDEFDRITESFFSYLDKNYQSLRRLHVLGGEPFYQTQFDRLVDFVINNNNPELEFNIVTNLMLSSAKLENFIQQMKQAVIERRIKRLDITASLDCWGDEQEYVRYGLDLVKWRENFERLAQEKWITLNINSTITSLTIKTVPEMIEYLNSIKSQRKVLWTFGLVSYKQHLHPSIFGPKFFDKDFEKILSLMQDEQVWDITTKDYMQGIWQSLQQSTVDDGRLRALQFYLDDIDQRRGLDWRPIFPWLDQHFSEVIK